MTSNITSDEAIAELTSMQEQLQVSNSSVEAIEFNGTNGTMDAEDVSMAQKRAENDTVDLSDLFFRTQ